MSDSLSFDIRASLRWLQQQPLALTTIADASQLEYGASLDHGTGEDQANKLWHDERTLAAAASEDLDLTDLTRVLFGANVSLQFAKIKSLLLVNLAQTAGEDLVIGGAGAANHGWGAPLRDDPDAELMVPADATMLLVNKKTGWTVVPGSADQLRITNIGSGSVSYRIVLVGVGA